jgi:DNA repair protein RadD
MTLRPYQQDSHDAIMGWVKKSRAPCCIEAATGAGKSHLIAAVAASINQMSGGKHILCLAPSAELVDQNSEKYKLTGSKASIFSASAGQKSLRYPVVFGTPMTVANSISRFGNQFAAVIVDECHGMTPTVKSIIEAMRSANENLRVIGLSATPYRMNTGYVFNKWEDGTPVAESQTKAPYFAACVHRITASELIGMGYLTPPVISEIGSDTYDTLGMEVNSTGKFNASDVDTAYHGHGRKTSMIVADIVARSAGRKGVMIFAATVQHANEIMASLPPHLSAIVTAKTKKVDRDRIIGQFKAQKIKYLVNVSVLTTGFDAPHVDVVALMRATESAGLLQQIIGRGLRISDGKSDCLIMDYAQNLERHCPDGDIFNPKIKVKLSDSEMSELSAICPLCDAENTFSARPNNDGYEIDEFGHFLDLDGIPIQTEWGPMPAHYGRRCRSTVNVAGDEVQCSHRWAFKKCEACDAENDIAARYCIECKAEIVDPNDKLVVKFKEMKRDPTRRQTDVVLEWEVRNHISNSGKATLRVDVVTPYRSFSFWILLDPTFHKARVQKAMFDSLDGVTPRTITYAKDANSGFYNVFAYNEREDESPQ